MYRRYKSKLLGTPLPYGLPPGTPRQRTLTTLETFKSPAITETISEDDPAALNNDLKSEEWREIEEKLLTGWMDHKYPQDAKVVRIFTSSTFTDTRHERNALMENVYPKLNEYCKEYGYEFQVVDMRWGVRDEASNDHTTTELCMSELHACKTLSTGPYFVTFLSHKYGYRPFPRVIEATEFENILNHIMKTEDRDLLLKWFKKDENCVPVSYILQPISTYLPDFLEKEDRDKFKVARNTWWDVNDHMTELLATAATKALTAEEAHKYLMSVTENEITEGILKAEDTDKHCFWYNRKIQDIDQQPKTQILSKYKDANGPDDVVKQAHELLNLLKQEKIPKKLRVENILTYDVPWSEQGIDPHHVKDHQKYIDKLSSDFEQSMKEMIQAGIKEKSQKFSDPLLEEILQHVSFCNKKCESFHGRDTTLEAIKKYVESRGKLGPCVLHGESGSGKTSVMAMVTKQAQSWLDHDAVVIARFVGTTQDSSGIRSLLLSILQQLSLVYKVNIRPPTEDVTAEKNLTSLSASVLGATLQHFLKKRMMSMTMPLVLIIDSLDQLSKDDNPESLFWLPEKASRKVRIILSTLPDNDTAKYGFLPKLQEDFSDKSTFIPVPKISPEEVTGVLDRWLSLRQRKLTSHQLSVIREAFENCPIPLYLNLCFEKAINWTSYQTVDTSSLNSTVQEAITQIFSQVELKHGFLLTSHILAYITASRNGLSEAELEDILSCDEDVLNDVYQYWTPPVRRLPPLLLVRVRSDLQHYLVDRGSEGTKVIFWHHRQFVETARKLYLNPDQPDHCRNIHRGIAEFFLGRWADTPKPFISKQGTEERSKRMVASQPLKIQDSYNVRKLQELPEHLMRAEMVTEVQEVMFYSLEWLMAKLKGTSFFYLVGDLEKSLVLLEHVSDFDHNSVDLLLTTLRLSQNALAHDPDQLPGQLLGRLPRDLDRLRSQCRDVTSTHLLPSKPFLFNPGGGLLHQISDHSSDIVGVDMSSDGRYVITCAEEPVLHVWDTDTGVLLRKINVKLKKDYILTKCGFCCDDSQLILNTEKELSASSRLVLINFETGTLLDMPTHNNDNYSVFAEGKTKAVVLYKNKVYIVDLKSGEDIWGPVRDSDKVVESTSMDYLVCANDEHICFGYRSNTWFKVVDLSTKEISPKITPFKAHGSAKEADTVDTMVISPDKGYLIVQGFDNGDLKMYELKTKNLLKTLKAEDKYLKENLRLFPGRDVLVFQYIQNICMWNLEHPEEMKEKFPHSATITHWASSSDLVRFVTVASDNAVRIWSNDVTQTTVDTTSSKKLQYGSQVFLFPFPQNERYLLLAIDLKKDKGVKVTTYCFEIHDLLTETVVKTVKVTGEMKVSKLNFITDTEIVLAANRRVRVINLSSGKVEKVLNGILPETRWYIGLALNKTAIVSLTRNTRGVKLMSLETGQVTATIRSTGRHKLNSLLVGGEGSLAVTCEEEEHNNHIVIFNLLTHQVSHTLSLNDRDSPMDIFTSAITTDEMYLVNQQYGPLRKYGEQYSLVYIWNLNTGDKEHCLYDKEDFEVYEQLGHSEDQDLEGPDVKSSLLLQGERPLLVQAGYDGYLRVFDVRTGELEHKFYPPHGKSLDEWVQSSRSVEKDRLRYVVSCGRLDNSFWIYGTADWNPVSSFISDVSIKQPTQVGDGSILVGWDDKQGQLLVWHLSGEHRYKLPETPLSFEQLEDTTIELESVEETMNAEADDPDSSTSDVDEYGIGKKSRKIHNDVADSQGDQSYNSEEDGDITENFSDDDDAMDDDFDYDDDNDDLEA